MINNNFGVIKNFKDMNDLMIDDGDIIKSYLLLMKFELVDFSFFINKVSLGLIIIENDLFIEK